MHHLGPNTLYCISGLEAQLSELVHVRTCMDQREVGLFANLLMKLARRNEHG